MRDFQLVRILASAGPQSTAGKQAFDELWARWYPRLWKNARELDRKWFGNNNLPGLDYEAEVPEAGADAAQDAARFWNKIQRQSPDEQDRAIGCWLRLTLTIRVGNEARRKRIQAISFEELGLDLGELCGLDPEPEDTEVGEEDETGIKTEGSVTSEVWTEGQAKRRAKVKAWLKADAEAKAMAGARAEALWRKRFEWIKQVILLLSAKNQDILITSFAFYDKKTREFMLPPAQRNRLKSTYGISETSIRIYRRRVFWDVAIEVLVRRCAEDCGPEFSVDDVGDWTAFAGRLRRGLRLLDNWVKGQLPKTSVSGLEAYLIQPAPTYFPPASLVQDLNGIVNNFTVFEDARFRGMSLRGETQRLLRKNPQGFRLQLLNRLLLEDGYPLELPKKPRVDEKTVMAWCRRPLAAGGEMMSLWKLKTRVLDELQRRGYNIGGWDEV